MTPRLHELPILGPHGFSRLAYAEWGPADAMRTVVCAHGLTRTGRDFDPLAIALAEIGFRVVSPDMPGRGCSPWLEVPEDYAYPLYASAAAALIARLGVTSVLWVGTSMGGLIGMMLAAQKNTPVERLVMNDIGPFIPKAALVRLAGYVGGNPQFASMAEAEAYLRQVHAPFGALTDAQWRHLAEHSVVRGDDGRLKLHYDPAIAAAFTKGEPQDVVLWPVWDQVACPTLVIRGRDSDLLPAETAAEMVRRGKAGAAGQVRLVEIAGCGHAPALMDPEQIARVAEFLTER